jgi:diguanylate cyclase (GGDEF)-like protein/PAS domain S-box-containing protein
MPSTTATTRKAKGKLSDPDVLVDLVSRISEGIYITNEAGEIIDANPGFLRLTGIRSLEELKQYRTSDFLPPAQRAEEKEILERDGHVKDFELTFHLPDGTVRTVLDTAYVAKDPVTGQTTYRGVVRDITERKGLEGKLLEQSVRDPLTGCFNRRGLAEFENREAGKQWACIVVDIDDFKHYNDTYGHLAGDEALTSLTRFLYRHLRSDASIVRMGGDEFLILLPSVDLIGAKQTANRIEAAAAQEGPTPFSMGYAAREGKETLEKTIHRADQNLYGVRTFMRTQNKERRVKK